MEDFWRPKVPPMVIRALGTKPGRGTVIHKGSGPITIEVAGFRYSVYPNPDGSLKIIGANGSLRIKPEGGVNACSIGQVRDLALPAMDTPEEEDHILERDPRYDFPTAK